MCLNITALEAFFAGKHTQVLEHLYGFIASCIRTFQAIKAPACIYGNLSGFLD
jgi:hypothetical protein